MTFIYIILTADRSRTVMFTSSTHAGIHAPLPLPAEAFESSFFSAEPWQQTFVGHAPFVFTKNKTRISVVYHLVSSAVHA